MGNTCLCVARTRAGQGLCLAVVSRPGFACEVLPVPNSFPSEAELAKLPGVRIIPIADVVPGPTADIYAFTRETVQRNMYRIPVR